MKKDNELLNLTPSETINLTRREARQILDLIENPPPPTEKFLEAQARYRAFKHSLELSTRITCSILTERHHHPGTSVLGFSFWRPDVDYFMGCCGFRLDLDYCPAHQHTGRICRGCGNDVRGAGRAGYLLNIADDRGSTW